ncbi:hypothetical protein [Caballeronia cordobensis]|uniref:hypothetical protein n=1 Tax=Caballeronia cordobensis TaxID=1353886 RepID=UPI000AA8763D|nr:hypothetical protein [Caballeronia cordobensis]
MVDRARRSTVRSKDSYHSFLLVLPSNRFDDLRDGRRPAGIKSFDELERFAEWRQRPTAPVVISRSIAHPVCALKIDFNDDAVAHVPKLPRVMRKNVFQHGVSVGLNGQSVINVIWLPLSLRKPSNQGAIQAPKGRIYCRPG